MLRKFDLLLILTVALVLAACTPSSPPAERSTATVVVLTVTNMVASPTDTFTPIPATPTAVPPTATATPISPTPTAISPTATATPDDSIKDFPTVNCCKGRGLLPGQYKLPDWLDLLFTIEVTDGWRVMNEEQAKLFTLARGNNSLDNPSELVVFMNASSADSVESLMAQFLEEPNIMPLGELTMADIAGYVGLQQDFAVVPNPDYAGNPQNDIPAGVQSINIVEQFFTPGFQWTNSSPESQLRFVVVNVSDSILFIYLEAQPDNFSTLVADANTMLQTLARPTPKASTPPNE